jgi:hypothetical protein
VGKTLLATDIAARHTSGQRWPDGSAPDPPGDVYILNDDETQEDETGPRFMVAGGDGTRLKIYDDLAHFLRHLEEMLNVCTAVGKE